MKKEPTLEGRVAALEELTKMLTKIDFGPIVLAHTALWPVTDHSKIPPDAKPWEDE